MENSTELNQLTLELAAIEKQHATIARRVSTLSDRLEEQKIVFSLGQAKRTTVDELQKQLEDSQAAAAKLSDDIATRRTFLEARRDELADSRRNAERQTAEQERRKAFELFAPLLSAAAKCAVELASMPGSISLVRNWLAAQTNRSDTARLTACQLTVFSENLLSGREDFLSSAIGDLRAAVPDLITADMEAFIANRKIAASDSYIQAPAVGDAKAQAAADFAEFIRKRDAESAALEALVRDAPRTAPLGRFMEGLAANQ